MAILLSLLISVPATHAATTVLEAESATLSGGATAATEHPGYTGSGFVGGYTDGNKGSASTTFAVTSAVAGTGSVKVRYANGTGVTMTLSLYANGVLVRQVSFPPTANWQTWSTRDESVPVRQGGNTVALRFATTDSGNVNLDNITASTPDSSVPPAAGVLEAESAALAGGTVVATEHPGYTGSGFVGGYTDGNKGTASTTFTVSSAEAGTGSVRVRYANGTGATMTLSLYANGVLVRQVSFPSTANWQTWATRDESVPVRQGSNTVALTFTAADSGNINLDHIEPTTPTTPPPVGTLTHQAETAFVSGGPSVATSGTGHEGTGYLTGFTTVGARVVFAVNAPTAKTYPLAVRYRATATATITLTANGTAIRRLILPGTGGSWSNATTDVPLRSNLNTLTLRTEPGDNGGLALDGIGVTDSTPVHARGATLPYSAYELEDGATTGSTIGPDRTYLTVAAEASARRAVVLDQTGEWTEFTLTKPANALTLRYSLPDNAAGTGINATLSLYANGAHIRDLDLSSKYAWVYGAYPYGNDPSQGAGHHFFDESRVLIGSYPAGTVLRLRKDSGDTAASYTLDLAETEVVAPDQTMPAGFVAATTLGVTANDGSDDTAALNSAVATVKAQGRGLWLPAGTYNISNHINLTGIALRGAGEWSTILRGANGKGGLFGRGGTNTVQDLTIAGDVSYRDDSEFHAAIEGDFGSGSTLQHVWIEHTKVGLWIDGPTTGLLATALRIRDTFADGVNLHRGTADTEVSHSSIRNTGDDALAMWSEAQAVSRSAFRFNTVQLPLLGNTIGIYGGHANRAEDNILADTVTAAAGIAVGNRFAPVNLSGTTSVQRNTLRRTGGFEPNWQSAFGALWIYAETADITAPILVKDIDILDSTYSGVLLSYQRTITNLTLQDVRIQNTGRYGIEINAAGSATFSGVTVTGTANGGLNLAGGMTVIRGSGNSGW